MPKTISLSLFAAYSALCLTLAFQPGFALAEGKRYFSGNVAKKLKDISFDRGYHLVCSERRVVSHPDQILKTWKPNFEKASRIARTNKDVFAKVITASGVASRQGNVVLYRVEMEGDKFHSSHCLLAQTSQDAKYFERNFYGFNERGRSDTNTGPYKFEVYELRKPFRQATKRQRATNKTLFWNVTVHPQQVFLPN
jgi:hypothetical protein